MQRDGAIRPKAAILPEDMPETTDAFAVGSEIATRKSA